MNDQSVTSEVRELREQIVQLRQLLEPNTAPIRDAQAIKVYVERSHGERRPYLFIIRSPNEKRIRMSLTRTAIFLTLLADLEQRSSGLNGISSTRAVAVQLLQSFEPQLEDSAHLQEQIRVALYRFAQFWNEEFDSTFPAYYDSTAERLRTSHEGLAYRFDISSTDPTIIDAMPKLGGRSMLDRLQKDLFLFVPGGGAGGERFLKEIYSSPGNLKVNVAYARPQIITLPHEILKKYSNNTDSLERHKIMHQRLIDGTLSFLEIVPESSLEKMIEADDDGTYSYFPGMSGEEVDRHLEFLSDMIRTQNGYRLVLTRAEAPFYVGIYESLNFQLADFFRLQSTSTGWNYSSFAAWGGQITATISTTVMEWLMNHPSSSAEPTKVLSLIDNARENLRLRKSGN